MSAHLPISRQAMQESVFVAQQATGCYHVLKNRSGGTGFASTAGMLRNLLTILDESDESLVITVMPARKKIKI